jgi:hypothetical protein
LPSLFRWFHSRLNQILSNPPHCPFFPLLLCHRRFYSACLPSQWYSAHFKPVPPTTRCLREPLILPSSSRKPPSNSRREIPRRFIIFRATRVYQHTWNPCPLSNLPSRSPIRPNRRPNKHSSCLQAPPGAPQSCVLDAQ